MVRDILSKLRNWWRVHTSYLDPESLEQIEIELTPSVCQHDHMVVVDFQEERRVGAARYVLLLIECSQCHDMWRIQHRINEQAAVRMAARADETLRLLLDNRFKGQRSYSPYRTEKPKKIPVRKK